MYFKKTAHTSFIGVLICLAAVLLFPSCNTNKYLKDDETYLHKNNIILQSEKRIKNKGNLKDELATLFKQKPNKRFLRLTRTRLWAYHKTKAESDTTRFKNLIRNKFAEKPQIYNFERATSTAENMKYFLRNKGYHNAEVDFEVNHGKKKTIVDYVVDLQNLYTIDTLTYESKNEHISALLDLTHKESFLAPGAVVDGKLYELEATRITNLLKNHGYAYFDRNYISPIDGDSTNYTVKALLQILGTGDELDHQIYNIKDIIVYPKYKPGQETRITPDTIVDGIKYVHNGNSPGVKYESINEAIYIKKGAIYRKDNFDATNHRLNDLGVYRFVDIKIQKDPVDEGKIITKIFLTPSKKYVIGYDVDLNNSRYDRQRANTLIGTAVSLNLRNRNVRNRAGLMINNFEVGTEVNPFFRGDSTRFFNTVDVKLQTDFLIPKFVDPLKLWKGLNKINIVSDKFYKVLNENATTKISASYNYLLLFEFRSHNLFNANFLGYSLKLPSGHQLTLNHTGINYLSPRTEAAFDTILMDNPFLQRSFGRQFFTGLILKDFTYTYITPSDGLTSPFYFRASFEQSGAEVALINWLANGLSKPFQFASKNGDDPILFYHYINLEVEAKRFYKIGTNQEFALRGNIGIADPFAPSDEVPYVKQFYVGGPTSIRAWRIRELGPGSYIDTSAEEPISYYQTGDFKMEFNAEYRFPIYWYFEGALFLDAGNIFTFDDKDRPGSRLDGNFINKMAVGGGYGLRFDATFVVFRFDMGMKMRLPYEDENNHHWQLYQWRNWNFKEFRKNTNFNLAIGYPF